MEIHFENSDSDDDVPINELIRREASNAKHESNFLIKQSNRLYHLKILT
jgi:hypothetical protein